jgi:hypothetical protein
MGFFGTFEYGGGSLVIDVHDSDFATVDYRSAAGEGRCYLGFQPRDYFEDPTASDDVDLDREAAGLAGWARETLGVEVAATQIRPLLAEAGTVEPADDFVEETVARLLRLLQLPVPDELPT